MTGQVLLQTLSRTLIENPPPGLDAAYIHGFFERNRSGLAAAIERHLDQMCRPKMAVPEGPADKPPPQTPVATPAGGLRSPTPLIGTSITTGDRVVTEQGQHGVVERVISFRVKKTTVMPSRAGIRGTESSHELEHDVKVRLDSGQRISTEPELLFLEHQPPNAARNPATDENLGPGTNHTSMPTSHQLAPGSNTNGASAPTFRPSATGEQGSGPTHWGGPHPFERHKSSEGCFDISFPMEGHGRIRVVCGQPGRRDVWNNLFVGRRRYGHNGGRWARGKVPPASVLREIRARGITAFESRAERLELPSHRSADIQVDQDRLLLLTEQAPQNSPQRANATPQTQEALQC